MTNSGTVSRKIVPKVLLLVAAIALVTTGILCVRERRWRAQVANLIEELIAYDAQLMGSITGISFDEGFSIPEIQAICDRSTEFRQEAVSSILEICAGRTSDLRDHYVLYSEAEDVFAGCVKCMLRAMANLSKEMDKEAIERKLEAYVALYGEEDGKDRMIQEFKDLADAARNAGTLAKRAYDDAAAREAVLVKAAGRKGLDGRWERVFQDNEDVFSQFIRQLRSI